MELNLNDMEEIQLNKKEFINEVAKRCMVTDYIINEIYNISSELIAEKLISGEEIELPKLGRFHLTTRKATIYKNLFGKKERIIETTTYPIFKICNSLKTRVKNGYKYKNYMKS